MSHIEDAWIGELLANRRSRHPPRFTHGIPLSVSFPRLPGRDLTFIEWDFRGVIMESSGDRIWESNYNGLAHSGRLICKTRCVVY